MLLLHSGKCGQINEAIKIGLSLYFKETRLVQLNNHRVCEVKLKHKWILIDGTNFKNNEVFIYGKDTHNLLNVEEIHKNHKIILDKLGSSKYYYIINIKKILNDKIKFKHLYNKDNYQEIKEVFCSKVKNTSIESFLSLLSKRYNRNHHDFYKSFCKKPIYKDTFK